MSSDPSNPSALHQVPGATLAGALLTWLAGAFVALLGLALLIATSTGATGLAGAIAAVTSVGSGVDDTPYPAAWVVLVLTGAVPSALAVPAVKGSRAGLVALTILGALYVVLVFVALGLDHASPALLFGLLWVGIATALFWLGQHRDGGTASSPAASTRRPAQVAGGAGLLGLAGVLGVVLGGRMMGSGLSASLHPDPARVFGAFDLHFGVIVAAVGAIVLVLAVTAFLGSMDMLVALTVVCALLALLTLSVAMSGADGAAGALVLVVAAWFGTGIALLWSRTSRHWYRRQRR